MTLADLLNTLESADMLRIIKGDEEIFVGSPMHMIIAFVTAGDCLTW